MCLKHKQPEFSRLQTLEQLKPADFRSLASKSTSSVSMPSVPGAFIFLHVGPNSRCKVCMHIRWSWQVARIECRRVCGLWDVALKAAIPGCLFRQRLPLWRLMALTFLFFFSFLGGCVTCPHILFLLQPAIYIHIEVCDISEFCLCSVCSNFCSCISLCN